jgi:hypothetical protein
MAKSKEDFTDVIVARDAYHKAYAEFAVYEHTHDVVLRTSDNPKQAITMKSRNALFNKARRAFHKLTRALKMHGLER